MNDLRTKLGAMRIIADAIGPLGSLCSKKDA